jgi:hypothetical protein
VQSVTTSGPQAVVQGYYPGVEYDPISEKIVAWIGGATVYTLDLNTMSWTTHPSTGSVVPARSRNNYAFNRWRYVPSKNAFVTVSTIDTNVFIYRLSNAAPDTTPPNAVSDLRAQ